MLVKMNWTKRGSEDGYSVKNYEKDAIYDIANGLASFFIRKGVAAEVNHDPE